MANGIANKEIGKKPAEQNDNTIICVVGLAKTNKELAVHNSKTINLKEQIKAGDYITIKLSDKPLQVEQKGQGRD